MKRFYCTECKRVKRVRNFPSEIHENMNAKQLPGHAFFGVCNSHSDSRKGTIPVSQLIEQFKKGVK